MLKMNCWEFRLCGREEGGDRVEQLGVCPAATHRKLDGVHNGINAGRSCWVVAGTLCDGKVQGSFAQKISNCMACDFYKIVRDEEKGRFKLSAVLVRMTRE